MKRTIITITENGTITVPNNVRMTVSEIANLFGIYYQTTKRHIRAIEKSGTANGDHSMTCVVEGKKVVPEYYGLEMVIAVAFRVKSKNAELFREWILRRLTQANLPQTIILQMQKAIWN